MFDLRALSLFAAFATSVLAQDHSSEQSEAQITDPNAECTAYAYPPASQFMQSLPRIWYPATLLPTDTEGQNMWSQIANTIPNIQPKGQLNGSTIGTTYDNKNDPDCWWSVTRCTLPKAQIQGLTPDVADIPEPKTMGYAFDDGPNCTHNIFYDYLASQDQKATMFYIGSSVVNWPLEAQRAVADGHELCVHTWSHRYMTAFSSQDAFAELWYSIKAIKYVTGVTPTCWRPPYGDIDDRIRAIAHALGLQTIMWKYDSNDWRVGTNNITSTDVDNSYNLFINNLTSGTFDTVGGIMLTHELNNLTMAEAVKFYPKLKSSFEYMVPIGVALNKTQPYKETNYSLPTFEEYISGETATSGNNGSSGTSGTASPSGTSTSAGSNSKKSSSGHTVSVSCGAAAWWTMLLSAAMLLSSGLVS